MFVITFIDNHRVNTVIYSAGIGLSFSHKFHQDLINSTQWTSTTWPHMNWEHQQSCKSITKFCGQVHIYTNCRESVQTAGCVSFLRPQPLGIVKHSGSSACVTSSLDRLSVPEVFWKQLFKIKSKLHNVIVLLPDGSVEQLVPVNCRGAAVVPACQAESDVELHPDSLHPFRIFMW